MRVSIAASALVPGLALAATRLRVTCRFAAKLVK